MIELIFYLHPVRNFHDIKDEIFAKFEQKSEDFMSTVVQ